ncbi:MAG: DUF3786 domain-containing protein [Desulfobacteraceae bacterium]
MTKAEVFEETYQYYLKQIHSLQLADRQDILGFEIQQGRAEIPFFNTRYFVSPTGIIGKDGKVPHLSVCVVLCKYLLMCPAAIPPAGNLAAFKDFKDAAPLIQYFDSSVQGEIARTFSGNSTGLENVCQNLDGIPVQDDWPYQIKYRFNALPRVPLFLLFNDKEEGFPAQCTILFERRTEAFLDMESVAMLAGALTHLLTSG